MDAPTQNRLSRQMQSYAKAQYAIAGALLLGLASFFLFVYRPQSVELSGLNDQVMQRKAELESDRSQTDRLPRVTLELQHLRARLANFKKLPPDGQLGQFIEQIKVVSEQAGLPEPTIVPGTTHVDELYSEQPINLTFRGDFTKVFYFVKQVEDMERLTRVRDVQIKSVPGEAGVVDVSLSVTIFYGES